MEELAEKCRPYSILLASYVEMNTKKNIITIPAKRDKSERILYVCV